MTLSSNLPASVGIIIQCWPGVSCCVMMQAGGLGDLLAAARKTLTPVQTPTATLLPLAEPPMQPPGKVGCS